MRIWLLAVGRRMPSWVVEGYDEYTRRMPPHLRVELKEVEPASRRKPQSAESYMAEEADRLRRALPPSVHQVALDARGRHHSTEELAKVMDRWQHLGSDVALIVGGPDGLAPDLLRESAERWSLSRLTLPHPLVRVVVAEQLYRAWTLLSGHPYHRG